MRSPSGSGVASRRIPRRGRWSLVFRALPPHQGTRRRARRRQNGGDIPQGAARRQSYPRAQPPRPHDAPEHMPSAHRRHASWTPARLVAYGEKIGPSVAALFEAVRRRPHPEQGFRTCLGILALTRTYDNARVDAACRRGVSIKARSVASSIDPEERPRPRLPRPDGRSRSRTCAPRQHPRRWLLPLTRKELHACPPHLRASHRPRTSRHGQGLRGSAAIFGHRRIVFRGEARPDGRSRSRRTRHQTARHASKFAALRQNAVVEDIDLHAPRGIDRALFQKLAAGDWINRAEGLLVTGPTGVGKSWIAAPSATRLAEMGKALSISVFPGCSRRWRLPGAMDAMPGFSRPWRAQLLILDDWGLAKFTEAER